MTHMDKRLSEARKASGYTQAQVADALTISTQSVSSWECGNSLPDIDKLPELAALYHVTVDWLLTGERPSAEVLAVTSELQERLFDEEHMTTYINAYCAAHKLYQTRRALTFAKEKHEGQFRQSLAEKNAIPYIYHPLLMTCHALALGLLEDDLLSTCLLHDVCEDCGIDPKDLPVSDAARESVRLPTKPADFDDSEEAERNYYGAIAQNRIAAIVKLLDRCHNVSEMAAGFTEQRMAAYIRETLDYIYPLMETARHSFPEYADALFLIRYHMRSVIETARHLLKTYM